MANKILEITKFNVGMLEDKNIPVQGGCEIAKNFDIFTNPSKMTSQRTTTTNTTGQSGVKRILNGSDNKIYGLGQISAEDGKAKIYEKSDINGNWSASTDGAVSLGIPIDTMFIEYKSFLYFFSGSSQISRWAMSGTITTTWQTPTITTAGPGIIGPDNKLYIAYDNNIGSFDNTTWNAIALDLPTNWVIKSMSIWRNYLVIGARPKNNYQDQSAIFIWDMMSDSFNDVIYIPEGNLSVVRNLGDIIVILADAQSIDSVGQSKLYVYLWAGGSITLDKEYSMDGTSDFSAPIDAAAVVKFNRLYFGMKFDGNVGVYAYGRKNSNYQFAMNLDRFLTADNSETSVITIAFIGDYLFGVHSSNGTVVKTNNSSSYGATSIYQSFVIGDFVSEYLAKGVLIGTEPLASAASFVVKYRKNEETSWTTVGTVDTDNIISSFLNISDKFFKLQIRIEATNKVSITKIKFIFADIPSEFRL